MRLRDSLWLFADFCPLGFIWLGGPPTLPLWAQGGSLGSLGSLFGRQSNERKRFGLCMAQPTGTSTTTSNDIRQGTTTAVGHRPSNEDNVNAEVRDETTWFQEPPIQIKSPTTSRKTVTAGQQPPSRNDVHTRAPMQNEGFKSPQ